jgi:hypothetical protein
MNWAQFTTLLTALTAILLAVLNRDTLGATRDQIRISEQGQITERYTQAVQLLGTQGEEGLDLRLGGIQALDRIAIDSPRDRATIAELLATFIRVHTPRSPGGDPCTSRIPVDIQAALGILTRRDGVLTGHSRLNLAGRCLGGIVLRDADPQGTDLSGADLSGSKLGSVNLQWTQLGVANLSSAVIHDSDFTHATLIAADLQAAELWEVTFTSANLTAASLIGITGQCVYFNNATLRKADLTGVRRCIGLAGADVTDVRFGSLSK